MASPQKENGFVAIANELFEAIYMHFDFTKRQLKVISAVIRHTYGWGRKTCTLSLREIGRETGLDYRHVSTTVQELIECAVLHVSGERGGSKTYALNKNYDEWGVTKTVTGVSPKRQHDSHQNGDTSVTKTVTHTIEKQLKQGERKHSPEFLAIWALYPAKKRRGLDFVTEEDERAVLDNAEAVRGAISQYLRETDETYICKAETFFRETWKAYAVPAEEQTKSKFGRTLE